MGPGYSRGFRCCLVLMLSAALMIASPVVLAQEAEPVEEVRDQEPWDGDGIIEPGEDEIAELQRAAQNPIADMMSIPFQNNTFFETGPLGKSTFGYRNRINTDFELEWSTH